MIVSLSPITHNERIQSNICPLASTKKKHIMLLVFVFFYVFRYYNIRIVRMDWKIGKSTPQLSPWKRIKIFSHRISMFNITSYIIFIVIKLIANALENSIFFSFFCYGNCQNWFPFLPRINTFPRSVDRRRFVNKTHDR